MAGKAVDPTTLYEQDFYRWAMENAAALRRGDLSGIDVANIAEELEDLGRSERRQLRHRLEQLMLHVLKWSYQPAKRSAGWRASVNEQRARIERILEENPSLRKQVEELVVTGYRISVDMAVRQTGFLPQSFPAQCPFTFGELMSKDLDEFTPVAR